MDSNNSLKVVVHYLLIGDMTTFNHWDEFPMVSTLMYGYTLDRTYVVLRLKVIK